MRKRAMVIVTALVLLAGTVLATSELVLQDGRVLTGREVRRDGENYVLVLEGGDSVVIPSALVREVRLAESPPSRDTDPETGLTPDDPTQIAGPETPEESGLQKSEPRQLAGAPVRPPSASEQLAVFGEPSKFQGDPSGSEWRPSSDWDMDSNRTTNFAPSEFPETTYDPEWKPSSDWDTDPNRTTNFAPSSWPSSSFDNSWTPTDGFAR